MEATHEAVLTSSSGAGARTVRRPAPRRGPGRDRNHALGRRHPTPARRPPAPGVDHRRHDQRARTRTRSRPGVVAPTGDLHKRSVAGVLWLHWLGHLHNDRSEFLPRRSSSPGAASSRCYRRGYFPWVPNPDGTAGDVTLVRNQVAAHAAALDHLAGQPGVDPARIARGRPRLRRHVRRAARRPRPAGVDAGHAGSGRLWANWFATYWLQLEGERASEYAALFAGLDPVEPRRPARLATCCSSGPARTRSCPRRSAPRTSRPTRGADHHLRPRRPPITDTAIGDLVAFLPRSSGWAAEPTVGRWRSPGPGRCTRPRLGGAR